MPEFTALFGTVQAQVIVALVFVDLILAVLAALFKKQFSLRQLGNFMQGLVLKYIFGFAVIELVGQALPGFGFLVTVVFVVVAIALASSILRHVGQFGVPLPKLLQ